MANLSSLNPQQREAVRSINGPMLILAGAGTGKTRVITCRIAFLIEQGVAPANILAVTFTNKAAREMQERVTKMIPRSTSRDKQSRAERPTICTFHSLCVRILRQHIERLGYKRNFVIYNESEQLGAIKKVLSHISAKGEKADPKLMLSLLSRSKNSASALTDLKANDNVHSPAHSGTLSHPMGESVPGPVDLSEGALALAERVRARYESALRACNAVDFDDLLLLTLRLFEEHPETLEACRAAYRHVMVDEYQDTNAAQFRLLHLLTSVHRNLCVVGDDDQSIYGWRGAEIANLLELEKFFPEVKIIKLEQNYRSTNVILSAANALIRHNSRRRAKHLWSDKGHGAKVLLQTFVDDEAEARGVVEQIEYARQIQGVPWQDQAILFRTNIQSRPLETALRQSGVRYHLIGGQSFFDRREVKDFLSYLKLLLNPHDDISLLRVANVPARGLSETTMGRLLAASHERKGSVFSAMLNPAVQISFPAPARESIQSFVEFVERTRSPLYKKDDLSLRHWAQSFIAEIEYLDEIRRSEKNPENAEARIRNLTDLMATLDGGAAAQTPAWERLQMFLEELMLDEDRAEEKERTGDAVTLITMHSCKGLEFPHVFVVGLEDGLLPHSRSKLEGTLDEERRLFYVAITRAMKTVSISWCLGRRKYGESVPCHPSPFLKELPQHLVELAEERSNAPVSVAAGKSFFDKLRSTL